MISSEFDFLLSPCCAPPRGCDPGFMSLPAASSAAEDASTSAGSGQPRLPLRCFCAGLDIGGTLCKLVYFELAPQPGEPASDTAFRTQMQALLASKEAYGETGQRDYQLEFESQLLGGRLHLMHFETRKMETFLELVCHEHVVGQHTVICATGGGARKFRKAIGDILGIELPRHDELQCLVDGINLVLQHPAPELYTVDHTTYRSGRMGLNFEFCSCCGGQAVWKREDP